MNPLYPDVALRAGHRCEYCHAPETVFNFGFEVEHIAPRSRSGPDLLSNTGLACHSCNLFKSACLTAVDPADGSEVRLFHPRQDRWDEHFRVNLEGATIEGLTPIGRATVARLRMNSSAQIVARRQWMRLEQFP